MLLRNSLDLLRIKTPISCLEFLYTSNFPKLHMKAIKLTFATPGLLGKRRKNNCLFGWLRLALAMSK